MKKLIIIFCLIFFLIGIGYYFRFFPVVINNQIIKTSSITQTIFKKGDEVKLLNNYDFNNGNYSLYIVFNQRESFNIGCHKVLYTADTVVLNELKESFVLNYTGGDIATYESFLYLFKREELICNIGIGIDEAQFGIQSREYGWLCFKDREKLLKSLDQLRTVYLPLIIL